MLAIIIRIVILTIIRIVPKKRVLMELVDDHDVKTCLRDTMEAKGFFVVVCSCFCFLSSRSDYVVS